MTKREELTNPESCLNKASPNELMFVLLARDEASPHAIDAWIKKRIDLKKNTPFDAQIIEAQECARAMRLIQRGVARSVENCKKGIHSIDTTVSSTICVYCNKDLSEFYKK